MNKSKLELYNEYFYINPKSTTGLTWKKEVRTGKEGRITKSEIGCDAGLIKNNYFYVGLNKRKHRVHRIIFMLNFSTNLSSKEHIDHIDGNTLNNSISNLRLVSHKTNTQNQKMTIRNKSGVTGVYLDKKKGVPYYWVATWTDSNVQKVKRFSILKFGNEESFLMAKEYRELQISYLNTTGNNYSDRHGDPDTKGG